MLNRIFTFALILMVIVVWTGLALAGNGSPPVVGKTAVSLTVPKVAKSECKSLAAGKAGTASFDVSGTTMVNVDAFTSDVSATAVNLKRKWNTNTAYMPVRGAQYNLPVEVGATSLVFGKYSAADNSVTPRVCVEKN